MELPQFLSLTPQFITDVDQGSVEWLNLRRGKATASNFHRIVTEVRGEYSAQAGKYAREIAVQRLCDEDTEQAIGHLKPVERGTILEADAAAHYEKVRGRTTKKIGLIISADGTRACSPDRISTDRLWGVEIKCPGGPAHLDYLENSGPGAKYRWQVIGSILVAKFEGWDFVSYHPQMREVIVSFDRRMFERELDILEQALERFEKEVQAWCDVILEKGFIEPVGRMKHRSAEEWKKLQEADPDMWAIG
jgi:YqaJ-like viral recombinase domain